MDGWAGARTDGWTGVGMDVGMNSGREGGREGWRDGRLGGRKKRCIDGMEG